MRPTDEHQSPSKRPNLISAPRRAGGEINILAMLDGQLPRPLARRFGTRPALLWYGGAGLLALTLVGTLAWLANGTGTDGVHTPVGTAFASAAAPASDTAVATFPVPAPVLATAPPEPAQIKSVDIDQARAAPALAAAPPTHTAAAGARVQAARAHDEPSRAAIQARGPGHPAAPRRRAPDPTRAEAPSAPADADVAWIAAIMRHHANRPGQAEPACTSRPCLQPPSGR